MDQGNTEPGAIDDPVASSSTIASNEPSAQLTEPILLPLHRTAFPPEQPFADVFAKIWLSKTRASTNQSFTLVKQGQLLRVFRRVSLRYFWWCIIRASQRGSEITEALFETMCMRLVYRCAADPVLRRWDEHHAPMWNMLGSAKLTGERMFELARRNGWVEDMARELLPCVGSPFLEAYGE